MWFLFAFVLRIFWHQFDIYTICSSQVINDYAFFTILVTLTFWPISVIFLDNICIILCYLHIKLCSKRPIITSPPEGVVRYCFHPVCCLSVCVTNILVFYFSAIRRDIDLKFIQDTNRVVLNSLRNKSKVKVTGTVHWFLKVQLNHKYWAIENFQFIFHIHLLGYSFRWNNKNLSEQRNDVTKNTSIFDV